MVSSRIKQKEQTRIIIIEAAIKQFAKDGLINAKTSDIAKTAGLSHGTVFAHFPTRDILLSEVTETVGKRIAERLHNLAKTDGPDGSLRKILEAHIQGLMEYETFYTRLVVENSLLPESSRHTLIMIQSTISFHLNQAVERETSGGTIRSFPAHLLFNTWIGLVHFYLANADLFSPGSSVLQSHGNTLINHFLAMLAP